MQTYEACVKDMRIDRVWRELDVSIVIYMHV